VLRAWHAALLLVVAVAVAYANSLRVPFQFDDAVVILGEPAITAFRPQLLSRRFLGDLSFALSYRLSGPDPAGYHVLNVAIHLSNALLVFWLARSLLRTERLRTSSRAHGDTGGPLVAALLFALHPIQTQAVTYVAQRYAILAAAFFLLATCAYVRFRLEPRRRAAAGWYALFLATAAAALWTKENTIVLPLAILVVEVVFFSGSARRRLLFLAPFLVGGAAAALAVASGWTLDQLDAATRVGRSISRHDYALTQLRVVASYLRLIVLPVGQNLDHDVSLSRTILDLGVLLAAALHAVLIGGAALGLVRARRTDPRWALVGFGVLWFYLALLVESSFIPMPDVMYEHRVYLPSVGLFIAAAALLARAEALAPRRARAAIVVVLTASLTALTIARNRVWQSELALWTDAAEKSPQKARPLDNVGVALFARGDAHGAIAFYERALRADPGHVKAYFNLGEALQATGDCAAAIPYYEWFLRWEPRYPDTYRNLAECCRRTGAVEAAERWAALYDRAVRESGGALPPSLR
jgi:Tfp pilus assembly protein PilF